MPRTVWLTGGSLVVTNDKTYLGYFSDGRVTVSNGTWLANEIDLGVLFGSLGTLTASGGQLTVTNGNGRIVVGGAGSDGLTRVAGSGQGRMFVGAGSIVTRELDIGSDNSLRGDLTISSSGSLTVLSRMAVGDCVSNALGTVVMTGGKLYVTNATHTAVLEVRNGFFLLDGGTVVVDKLVVTNACLGIIDHGTGTLTVGTLVLDPSGDADGDGLPNAWEQQHGLDPLSSAATMDPMAIRTGMATRIGRSTKRDRTRRIRRPPSARHSTVLFSDHFASTVGQQRPPQLDGTQRHDESGAGNERGNRRELFDERLHKSRRATVGRRQRHRHQ